MQGDQRTERDFSKEEIGRVPGVSMVGLISQGIVKYFGVAGVSSVEIVPKSKVEHRKDFWLPLDNFCATFPSRVF